MNSQQRKYVLTLVKEGSFSKAAEKLYITQPSFSQYIGKVERELGVKLFERGTHPLKLTQAGRVYVEAAEQMEQIEADMKGRLEELEHLEMGTLTLGATPFRMAYLLPRSIAEYQKLYPGIQVNFVEEDTRELANLLRKGTIDLYIGGEDKGLEEFRAEALGDEQFYLAVPEKTVLPERIGSQTLTVEDICSRNKRFLFAQQIDFTAFSALPLIVAQEGEYGLHQIKKYWRDAWDFQGKMISVKTLDTAFAFVNHGIGTAIIPEKMICFGNFREHPYYFRLPEKTIPARIQIYTRKNSYLSVAAQRYCQLLKELVTQGTWKIHM